MKRAFTLIELMIVVAIIGILAAIAIPGFQEARKQARNQRSTSTQAAPPPVEQQIFPGYIRVGGGIITVDGVSVSADIVKNSSGQSFYMYYKDGLPVFKPLQ